MVLSAFLNLHEFMNLIQCDGCAAIVSMCLFKLNPPRSAVSLPNDGLASEDLLLLIALKLGGLPREHIMVLEEIIHALGVIGDQSVVRLVDDS